MPVRLQLHPLADRVTPAAAAALTNGTLAVATDDADQRVQVVRDGADLVVRVNAAELARVPAAAVARLEVLTGAGTDRIEVAPNIDLPGVLNGGGGRNTVIPGGMLTAVLADKQQRLRAAPDPAPAEVAQAAAPPTVLEASEVEAILQRASAATASRDAIIAVVDRNGRILGVRVEDGVSPALTGSDDKLVFAVDGAVAKARTGAFFANSAAPLTSRTIQALSQSTVLEREVNSDPNVPDPDSPLRGPGFVAAVGLGGHFPPGIANTPPVDLFGIEHTNRDSLTHPGADRIRGTGDDIPLRGRFNIDNSTVPEGQRLFAPESFGTQSGRLPRAQGRGIGTLPGGIPLFKGPNLVGGIGVFFPGTTGFATEENNRQSTTHDPRRPDRSLEAEFVAFVAAGGASRLGPGYGFAGAFSGAPALPGFDLPGGTLPDGRAVRIDLVGITLDIYGPNGNAGPEQLIRAGQRVGPGAVNGTDLAVTPGGERFARGLPVPSGWLVEPKDGEGITAAEVRDIIARGLDQATRTRAAIRAIGTPAQFVFAVTDLRGEVVGLFRQQDATVFSIDVAVAKARNVRYYADAARLQPADRVPGLPPGTALTNRTFRFLAEPRFPEGPDTNPPGPFSSLLDGGADGRTARTVGAPKPASAFQSVLAFDAFNPGTNFRDPNDLANQNGIVFFPGSAPVYRDGGLIGGFGVSGDGVDQDDVATFAGSRNFGVPNDLTRADEVVLAGVRLPYQKFNRNPEGGIPSGFPG